ncbi:UNVERIFIED_CONTAM: Cyclic nucleotide-gated ion channel 1 [Sesamum radiatum]|uniref:Cyclic nucleotide-gated ion channel 1 n=1 Tax=Sesamum radiatum TaxID=300843 RepID=A0AAW2R2N6_SESRA
MFALEISIGGLVLVSTVIASGLQNYLRFKNGRLEEVTVNVGKLKMDVHRMLPENLRARIRRYEQYKWQEKRGVEEESLISNFPKDLRRDIKRHLCWTLLTRVPLFDKMDEQLLDAMCCRLKPVLYAKNSFIFREGDPIDEMLFIMKGNILTMTTNGGRCSLFNSVYLMAGDFCGEELLTWALDHNSSSSLPISTRTVQAVKDVDAFCLMPDDLKCVMSQFRRVHAKQLQHTFRQVLRSSFPSYQELTLLIIHNLVFHKTCFRFYSQQWRTWGACFIQAAWRRHYRRKIEKTLQEAEDRLQNALAKEGTGSSPSLAATVYASRFATNMLQNLRRKFYVEAHLMLLTDTFVLGGNFSILNTLFLPTKGGRTGNISLVNGNLTLTWNIRKSIWTTQYPNRTKATIRIGNRKFGDSDSEDDSVEDEEGVDKKSVIIDSGSHSDSSKEAEGSSGSVTGGKLMMDILIKVPLGVALRKKAMLVQNLLDLVPGVSCLEEEVPSAAEVTNSTMPEPVQEESLSASVVVQVSDKPLNFDKYHSAGELQVPGMERLKTELQVRGLKCGGTLQDRAARIFLLKTSPLEMLPKKLFAKK